MKIYGALRPIGLAAAIAVLAFTATQYLPKPAEATFNDSDGDTVIDLAELITGSDPMNAASTSESTGTDVVGGINTCNDGIDNDGDGLTDSDDPFCTDSDGDIVSDPSEAILGSDPNDSGSFPEDARLDTVLDFYGIPIFFCGDAFDNDGDGLTDADDPGCTPIGSDGDAFDDATEKRFGSDPGNPNSVPEHEAVNPGSCSDGMDNDLDGAADAADAACSSPTNDGRANARVISTLPYSDGPVVMKNAAVEPNEPRSRCSFGGAGGTVWYRYTAGANAVLIADTGGSSFETTLAVWHETGDGLSEVTCAAFVPDARVVFNVSAGETYFFQIDGVPYAQPFPTLSFNLVRGNPPANDNFVDAINIAALPFDHSANLEAARTELGEPSPSCSYGGATSTVWYRFHPGQDVSLLIDATGSDFTSFVGVWKSTVFGLGELACGGAGGGPSGARTAFRAEAGETYFLQAGRTLYGGLNEGFDLVLSVEITTPPANDNFAGAATAPSLPFHDTVDTLTASLEGAEPIPSCLFYDLPFATVWYKYTPGADTILVADLEGSTPFGSFIGIYTGTSLSTLNEAGCATPTYPYAQFAFDANAGETYYFQIGTTTYGEIPFGASRNWSAVQGDAAGGVIPPPIGSPTEISFNLDSFTVPSCAPQQFSTQDPLGDQIGQPPFIEPPVIINGESAGGLPPDNVRPDITRVAGGADNENVCLTIEFADPIDPPSEQTDNAVVGLIAFDSDENAATGFGGIVDSYCGPSGLGVDAELSAFSGTGVLVPITEYFEGPRPLGAEQEAHYALVRYGDRAITLIIPLKALGGDASFNMAAVFGSFYEPTDCAPNGGAIHVPGGAVIQPYIPGDVNCNGSPGPVDAGLILQYIAGMLPTLDCQRAADVNGDGRTDTVDVTMLLQYVADIIPSLPGMA
ncbi:MAG: dockerin type I domain-containing protein [Dehalococcoidia bacterium]